MTRYDRFVRLLRGVPLPAAVVDLDALDRNRDLLLDRLAMPNVTLRLASKSLRVPWLLRHLLDSGAPRVQGLMTYSAHETVLLAGQGFDDLLLAYPIGRPDEADALAGLAARGTRLWATIDAPEHVALLSEAASRHGTELRLCLDVDVSWRPAGGRAHFGVRRSPVRSPEDAVALGRRIQGAPGLRLDAVLAYEAQVAGIRERNPGSRHLDPVRRLIKRRSIPLAAARRRAVVDALRADGHTVTVINGGGSGSVASTSADGTVTEVTAGSGFVCSHLFDGYAGLPFEPAAFFALAVVRRSDPQYVTCAGGGYIASGPAGRDRLPIVHAPPGLVAVDLEGFGEVQTPFRCGPDAPVLEIGAPVICRHAKAGELMERFLDVLLVRGERVIERAPTLRGLGGCFL